jgi:hypothetical protein
MHGNSILPNELDFKHKSIIPGVHEIAALDATLPQLEPSNLSVPVCKDAGGASCHRANPSTAPVLAFKILSSSFIVNHLSSFTI